MSNPAATSNGAAGRELRYIKRGCTLYELTMAKLIAPYPFSAPNMQVVDHQIHSQRGVPLLDYIATTSPTNDIGICTVVQAALHCLDNLHSYGFVHGDARPCNFVIFRGWQEDGSNFRFADTNYFVAFVDWETLYVPPQHDDLTEDIVNSFVRIADSLKDFGIMQYEEYEVQRDVTYKIDVHAFCDDFIRAVVPTEATLKTINVLKEVRGHTPSAVKGCDKSGTVIDYTQYLNDLSQPVKNPLWAIFHLQQAHIPAVLRLTEWETGDCQCTHAKVCANCAKESEEDNDANIPYALPDLSGVFAETVKFTMLHAMRVCNYKLYYLKQHLLTMGARPGDIERLISYIK